MTDQTTPSTGQTGHTTRPMPPGVPLVATLLLGSIALSSCATGGARGPSAAGDAEWRSLATPRPEPLPGAPRLAFSGVELIGGGPWSFQAPVVPELGLSELVVAGLLRRRDVSFVERRRFGAAAEAEREGGGLGPTAPPVGVSSGAELTAAAVWLPLGPDQVALEVRLSDTETGALVGGRRLVLPPDAEPVGTARATVASLLAALEDLGRLPAWQDPEAARAAPAEYRPTGIPSTEVERFMRGLAAEERWNWEDARLSYQSAASSAGFLEAEAALARTARLRTGGTLGDS